VDARARGDPPRGRDSSGEMPENFLHMLLSFRDEEGQRWRRAGARRDGVHLSRGHETTAITLGWAFYRWSAIRDAEARVHEELARVLGGRPPAFEDVPNLPFTRAVIDETLRLYPPVHAFTRQAIGADEISGHKIPAAPLSRFRPGCCTGTRSGGRNRRCSGRSDSCRARVEDQPPRLHPPSGRAARICLGKHLGLLESTLLAGADRAVVPVAGAPGLCRSSPSAG